MEAWPLFGVLSEFPWWAIALGALVVFGVLGFQGGSLWIWSVAALALLYGLGAPIWLLVALVLSVLLLTPLRRMLLTAPMMRLLDALGILPRISPTEKTAIEAGNVWIEGELFSGRPNFKRILAESYPALTPEEQAFLDGPVEELCASVTDWEIRTTRTFPQAVWDIIRREKFFGLIVPKEFGGHRFSATANSAVVSKLNSHSYPLGITVMVPNSLGPAELLIHYGTREQQEYFLPRLADARLKPAFALTEPAAGSDAGAIRASGEVFRDDDGLVKIRLNWNKRYITLAAISDLLGLAFKLRDPDNILGKGTDLGITCALVHTDAPGVIIGDRHDPLGVPFVNAPTQGHDVVVPLDAIIGGAEGAGRGWQMLMECLAAGRGISLPASSVGSTKAVFMAASAHTTIRKQFGLPLGKFEGIQEALARIGGFTYLMDAARIYTVGAIDQGVAPAVVTAIVKYSLTELARKAVIDGMDIMAGNGISLGPRNTIAHAYVSMPIAITVEGANILTRTLMIFGQGAIRCHPWAYKEIIALEQRDLRAFDHAIWGHLGHIVRNGFRAVLLGLSRGRLASAAGVRGPAARYIRRLKWASAMFAFMADIAMVGLGGQLKRKEMITGRFADIFAWMYLAAATVRRFEAEGRRREDRAYFCWSIEYALAEMQKAFEGLYANMRLPGLTWLLGGPVATAMRLNRLGRGPDDRISMRVAQLMQMPGAQRSRMVAGCYLPPADQPGLGALQAAFALAYEADQVMRRVFKAVRTRVLAKHPKETLAARAHEAGLITADELALIRRAEAACWEAIQVDAFDAASYRRHHQCSERPKAEDFAWAV